MHPRAVRKVTEFLKILKNNGAQVTIEMDGREVGLRNPDEVERAVNRLAEILSSPPQTLTERLYRLNGNQKLPQTFLLTLPQADGYAKA